MTSLITLDDLACRTPDGETLFADLTLTLGRERTGLVGRNGVGKTSLIRLILGEVAPAEGALKVRARLGVLKQTLSPPPGASLADLLGVAEPLARLARIEAGAARGDDLEIADWTLAGRVDTALARVGLAGLDLTQPALALSGGQMTRAALGGLVIAEPDFLILDEPTNNLDADGRGAVADLLRSWTGGALVVSHDRTLLRLMDQIVELSSLGATVYGGDYDLYARRKAEAEAAAARALEAAGEDLARIRRETQAARERKARNDAEGRRSRLRGDMPRILMNARREKAEATSARLGQVAERRQARALEALRGAEARVENIRRLAFDLPPSDLPAGKPVLAFEDVAFAWPGHAPLFRGLTFSLTGPERVALAGPNGAGKSTLIRLALGELAPGRGVVRRGAAAVALDQRAALLDDNQSLVENYRRLNPQANANAAHAALARFLFRNTAAQKPASSLSGGERLRAALACVLTPARAPRLIILDEPTNHLDLASILAIEAALRGYGGALIVASHDGDFLKAIGVERWLNLGPAGR